MLHQKVIAVAVLLGLALDASAGPLCRFFGQRGTPRACQPIPGYISPQPGHPFIDTVPPVMSLDDFLKKNRDQGIEA